MSSHHLLTCAALVLSSTIAASGADAIAIAVVGLVIEAPSSVPPRQLRAMAAETAAIWRPYGIDISWPAGLEPQSPGDGLRLVVRLPLSPPERIAGGAPQRPLGSVLFIDDMPDSVMTIRPETIETVIRRADWNGRPLTDAPLVVRQEFAGRALGRVLAHELGHYLLAQKDHTPTGLMRRSFTSSELVNVSRRSFRLEQRDLAALGPRVAQLMAETRPEAGAERPFSASVCHAAALVCPTCPVCVVHPL